MKKKRVWRYECEYCGKKKYSAGAMSTHEKHCTMNPDRECRMCKLLEVDQQPIKNLLAFLPDPSEYDLPVIVNAYMDGGEWGLLSKDINTAMPVILQIADGCPACALAALRQRGYPTDIFMMVDWSYKAAKEAMWVELRDKEQRREELATYG